MKAECRIQKSESRIQRTQPRLDGKKHESGNTKTQRVEVGPLRRGDTELFDGRKRRARRNGRDEMGAKGHSEREGGHSPLVSLLSCVPAWLSYTRALRQTR